MSDFWVNLVRTLTQAPIFLGLVTLVGLVLQRKKLHEIIDGVLKTVVGMVMLTAGANLLTGTLTPLITTLNEVSHVKGVVPQNFAVFAEVLTKYSVSVVLAFAIGFFINLLIAKFIPFKRFKIVYLTVHITLILASFLVVAIPAALGWKATDLSTILLAGLIIGLYNTFSPAISRLYTKDLTNDAFTLGHNQQVGTFFAVTLAKLVGKPEDDAEKIQLPKSLSILKDTTVSLSILMPIIFIGIGLYLGEKNITPLSTTTYWLVWLFLQGITFTVGFAVLLTGLLFPHIGISSTVKKPALSLITLRQPITYKEKEIQAILTFCSMNREVHKSALRELTQLLNKDKIVERLSTVKNYEELVALILE